ncbi:hypothetical protein WBG78_22720 [Chryseolinea sp. T2]|uniref:hypothetical protein n=1 Tax=Chryseolinea sp. T2 TaxID=3129255 RepID=UPI0030773868
MMNSEFYRKYRVKYPSKLTGIEWWQVILVIVAAVLIEPIVVYNKLRHTPFTQGYYIGQAKYFLLLSLPVLGFFVWIRWRESLKRSRGYCWVGRFEVQKKHASFLSCHLMLSPGRRNRVKVNRTFFNKVNEGDTVIVRRNSLGEIERMIRITNLAARLRNLRSGSGVR